MGLAIYSFYLAGGPILFFKDGLFYAGLLGSGSIWRQEAEKAPDKTLVFI